MFLRCLFIVEQSINNCIAFICTLDIIVYVSKFDKFLAKYFGNASKNNLGNFQIKVFFKIQLELKNWY